MCWIDDAERYWPYVSTVVAARKEHECDECGRVITPGERYERMKGMLEGSWDTTATCTHCMWAREWLNEECGGFCHHGVAEELFEHWLEDPLYRSLNLGRRIIGMRRKWQRPDGSLMAVPA